EPPIIHPSTGPVIHTDSIIWRDPNGEIQPGQLAINLNSPKSKHDGAINVSEEWKTFLESLPAARFVRSTQRLLASLAGMMDEEQQRTIAVADCVLPFLAACRIPREQISDLIEGITDSRAKRVAELLFPVSK